MEKKLLGIILLSMAFGMFIARCITWGGNIVAFIVGVAGMMLLFYNC